MWLYTIYTWNSSVTLGWAAGVVNRVVNRVVAIRWHRRRQWERGVFTYNHVTIQWRTEACMSKEDRRLLCLDAMHISIGYSTVLRIMILPYNTALSYCEIKFLKSRRHNSQKHSSNISATLRTASTSSFHLNGSLPGWDIVLSVMFPILDAFALLSILLRKKY